LRRCQIVDRQTTARPPNDQDLIRRLQSGDEAALEYLVATYWHRLCRFVAGILLQEGGEEDVVQEAFVRLWMRRRKLRLEGSFKAFLFTLARNAAIDERRRWGRRETLASSLDPPPPGPSPQAGVEASELRAACKVAVSALPPRRREIFRLAREEGLTYREIAEVLGLSQQTVANQMSRALTSLHEALAPFLADEYGEGTGPGLPGG
jgi:RNA polymerase sigma-70 factor (ECF subfamily)